MLDIFIFLILVAILIFSILVLLYLFLNKTKRMVYLLVIFVSLSVVLWYINSYILVNTPMCIDELSEVVSLGMALPSDTMFFIEWIYPFGLEEIVVFPVDEIDKNFSKVISKEFEAVQTLWVCIGRDITELENMKYVGFNFNRSQTVLKNLDSHINQLSIILKNLDNHIDSAGILLQNSNELSNIKDFITKNLLYLNVIKDWEKSVSVDFCNLQNMIGDIECFNKYFGDLHKLKDCVNKVLAELPDVGNQLNILILSIPKITDNSAIFSDEYEITQAIKSSFSTLDEMQHTLDWIDKNTQNVTKLTNFNLYTTIDELDDFHHTFKRVWKSSPRIGYMHDAELVRMGAKADALDDILYKERVIRVKIARMMAKY